MVAREALQLLFNAQTQVNHEAAPMQQVAIDRVEHDAAAGGHQQPMAGQHVRDQGTFTATETGLAFEGEDGGDGDAGVLFEAAVEVDEVEPEPDRQAPADGTLASAHGADKHQVGRGIHAVMLASARMDSAPLLLVAGFGDLGARVAERRLAGGAHVLGLRRREITPRPGLRGLRVDLATGAGMDRLPRRPEALLYCPAPDVRDEAAYRTLYRDGLRRLLDRLEVPRVLLVSSTAVYAQDAGEWVDEDSPALASSFNGRVLLEAETEALLHRGGSVLRLSGLYGPGREAMLRRARAGQAGAQRWSNRVHIDDAAAAADIVLAAPLDQALGSWLGSDDCPALECDVQAWIRAREDLPAITPDAGPEQGRRVANGRLRGLGWSPDYADFRAGYAALTEPGV